MAILPAFYFGNNISHGDGPFCYDGIIRPDGMDSTLDRGVYSYAWNPFDVHPSYTLCGETIFMLESLGLIGVYFIARFMYRKFKR